MKKRVDKNNYFLIVIILIIVLGALLIYPKLTGKVISTQNLVAYWRFDNNADDSAGTNNGVNNGAVFADGKIDKALAFDGDDYVSVLHSTSLMPANAITVSAWIKLNMAVINQRTQQAIVEKANWTTKDGYWFSLNKPLSNELIFRIFHGALYTDVSWDVSYANPNVWYHIVGTYNRQSVRLYINGELKKIVPLAASIDPTTNQLKIGRNFNGSIDDVRIYNIALSAAEIRELYSSSLCSDSDNGKNEFVIGTLLGLGTNGSVVNYTDSCYDNSVFEGYCNNGYAAIDAINCVDGCREGVCLENICTSNANCSITQLCEFPVGSCSGVGSCIDVLQSCNFVVEPVCGCNQRTYSNDCMRMQARTSKKNEGECGAYKTCTDSDYFNYFAKGNVTRCEAGTCSIFWDSCVNSLTLGEYYCDGIEARSINYACFQGCLDGACTNEISCTDSDGLNYYLKGNTTRCDGLGCNVVWDNCINSTKLTERNCSGDSISSSEYVCSLGCENGACLRSCNNNADCNDANSCTNDVCNLTTNICQYTAITPCCGNSICEQNENKTNCNADCKCDVNADCEDNINCTVNTCVSGNCIRNDTACICLQDEDCNDNNICTNNYCNLTRNACQFTFNARACNDNNLCTINDVCSNGNCSGTLKNCDDGIACTQDSCSNGNCIHNTNGCSCISSLDCDDNNECTDNYCNINTKTCSSEFNTNSCDDNNANTENDVCKQGACVGTAVSEGEEEEEIQEPSKKGKVLFIFILVFLIAAIIGVIIFIILYYKKSIKGNILKKQEFHPFRPGSFTSFIRR